MRGRFTAHPCTPPLGALTHTLLQGWARCVLRQDRPTRPRAAAGLQRFRGVPLRKETPHESRRVHRHVQGRHRPAGGRVIPAALPALGGLCPVRIGQRSQAPSPAPHPPGRAGGRHQGRGPVPRCPPGYHRRRRDGHGQDLHRRRRSAHGGLQEDSHSLPASPDKKVETGGGGYGTGHPRSHRHLHHRPGTAAPLHRLRPTLRRGVQREGQAVLPLDARRHRTVGNVEGQAGAGRGDRGAVQGALLPRLHRPGPGQGRSPPDVRRPEPQKAYLPPLRFAPLAGRQVRPQEVPAVGLREEPDEGLLRPADR